jgi:two-component system response regulator ChvI
MEAEVAGQGSSPVAVSDGDRQIIRVLLVEGDKEYANSLITELTERDFQVRHFATGSEFLGSLDHALNAHVIVLDWHMPKMRSIDLLPAIRKRGIKLPVVFLTGLNLIHYESLAFERGAMDFIEKSRGVETLVRRLRRAANATDNGPGIGSMTRGRLTLLRHVSRALWDGVDLRLTVGEYNIVELLVLNTGSYVDYRAIYDVLRGPGFLSGRGIEGYRVNVRSALKRARHKFRALYPDFNAIESYMAFGYRWRTDDQLIPTISRNVLPHPAKTPPDAAFTDPLKRA